MQLQIDKFPCLVKIRPHKFLNYAVNMVPITVLRKPIRHEMKLPLIFIIGQGYAGEFSFIPLELLIDKTISLSSVKRWAKSKSYKRYLPYIYNSDNVISLDLID